MADKVRWGILATGAIAHAFARGLAVSKTGELVAVGSRSDESAREFAEEFGAGRAHGSYDALLADADVDAIYVSTPHPYHAEWTIKAAEAGKHVLVEKPISVNEYEAQAMIDAAVRNGTFLMEAFMYRCHPQTTKLVELIRSGAIGEVGIMEATFSFHAGFNPDSRLWSKELIGGGIMDVGGYPTSMSRLVAGAATGAPFADPIEVTGAAHLHPESGVDAWAAATLKFEQGIVSRIATGVGVSQQNAVRVYGSDGMLELPNPWVAERDGESGGAILVNARGVEPEKLDIPSPVTSFALEADVVGAAIRDGRQQSDAMSWADSLGNIRTQDAWRRAIGLEYPSESAAGTPHRISGRPLTVDADAPMQHGEIRHLDKPISRLVMGVDNQDTMPHAAMMFDEYFARGGNAFDTAWVYGATRTKLLGQWARNRGVRDNIVWIAKGAHTPHCNPEALLSQFDEQLGWFETGYADLYMLHRDNPEVPVGEFVDVLNDQVKAGRLKAFGGSNWSLERIDAANAYAESKGLQGFSVVSNNLSLAVMVNPVWGGCIHVHDDASTEWLTDRGLALLPWSSQARGFFIPERAQPGKEEDMSLVESWYSDENFQRQARAIEIAEKQGVEPINVALAWVLRQPYPTFPLVGPRTLSELRSTLGVFDVALTDEEFAYLDLKE